MQSVIGIDIGTTSTKGLVLGLDGKIVSTAQAGYEMISAHEGYAEIRPADLLGAVLSVLKALLKSEAPVLAICGVSFSCAMHSLLAVGQDGDSLTNAITWADLRSAGVAAELKATDTGREIYRLTGTPIHAMTPLCKLIWLKKHEPEVFSKAAKFIGIKEFIWHALFGKYQIDHSIASATGLFNIYDLRWNESSLCVAGITADKLSTPVDPLHTETGLLEPYRQELGSLGELLFVIGASDGCLANLGSGALHEGEASLTIGTSGALRLASAKPIYDPGERLFSYILSRDLYIAGGATNNGGAVVEWYVKNFMSPDGFSAEHLDDQIKKIAEVPAGAEGLICLPYLFGERAPIWNAAAQAVFFGIRPEHRPGHFLRALIEGISFSLFQIGAPLQETAGPIKKIFASGGFTRSAIWLQIIADVMEREVVLRNVADASAIGAALMGMQAMGLDIDQRAITGMSGHQKSFFPDPENSRIYRQALARFDSLYQAIKKEFVE